MTFSDVCIDYEPTISDMCAQYAMYGSAAVTDPNFQQYCLGGAQLQQSQGGGGASPIDIDNGIIASIFAGLEDLLKRDPTCEKWRASGIAGGDLGAVNFDIQQAAAGSGAAYLPAKITAVTNIGFAYPGYPSSPLASYPAITINANGAFFQPGPVGFYANAYQSQIGQLIGGTVQAEDFILLHELAHYLGVRGYAPNDGPRGVQGANNAVLYQNCNKTINAVHN